MSDPNRDPVDALALAERAGEADVIQQRLVKAIERRERAYLWTPADTISFIPRVLPTVYGDGRALFALATINQRPAYWVRGRQRPRLRGNDGRHPHRP